MRGHSRVLSVLLKSLRLFHYLNFYINCRNIEGGALSSIVFLPLFRADTLVRIVGLISKQLSVIVIRSTALPLEIMSISKLDPMFWLLKMYLLIQ